MLVLQAISDGLRRMYYVVLHMCQGLIFGARKLNFFACNPCLAPVRNLHGENNSVDDYASSFITEIVPLTRKIPKIWTVYGAVFLQDYECQVADIFYYSAAVYVPHRVN